MTTIRTIYVILGIFSFTLISFMVYLFVLYKKAKKVDQNEKPLFTWKQMRWFLVELVCTFSDKPSFFSRKRIESFILFTNGMALLDFYYIKQYSQLKTPEVLAIFAANMGYAGWQVTQIRKDIKEVGQKTFNGPPQEETTEEPTQNG